jgi:hypothetical protein
MRQVLKRPPLKIRGSMSLTGNLDKALVELKTEREQSLERLIAGTTGFLSSTEAKVAAVVEAKK